MKCISFYMDVKITHNNYFITKSDKKFKKSDRKSE